MFYCLPARLSLTNDASKDLHAVSSRLKSMSARWKDKRLYSSVRIHLIYSIMQYLLRRQCQTKIEGNGTRLEADAYAMGVQFRSDNVDVDTYCLLVPTLCKFQLDHQEIYSY